MRQQETAKTELDPPRPRKIGVLLVHGIGLQGRGDTLTHWGDAIYAWVGQWVQGWNNRQSVPSGERQAPRATVRFARTVLRAPDESPGMPAHASLLFLDRQGTVEAEWVLAEAWWAETFAPPSYGEALPWGLSVGPYLCFRYVVILARQLSAMTWPQWLSSLIQILAAFVAGLLIQIPLLTLSLLAVIPPLRPFLAGLQTQFTARLGDAYILTNSEVRFSAMISRVQRNLDWLYTEGECEDVVIIAESRGAAVVYQMLLRQDTPPPARLITVGSAIKKLTRVGRVVRKDSERIAWGGVGASGFLVALAGLAPPSLTSLPDAGRVMLFVSGMAVYITGVLFPFTSVWGVSEGLRLGKIRKRKVSHWNDWYTPNDPVSEGKILDLDAQTDPEESTWFSSQPIRNRDSVLYDHTSYWENTQQFVSRVVRELAAMTPHGALGHLEESDRKKRLDEYSKTKHPNAINALTWSYLVSVLDTVLLLVVLWVPWLVRIGGVVQGAFGKLAEACLV